MTSDKNKKDKEMSDKEQLDKVKRYLRNITEAKVLRCGNCGLRNTCRAYTETTPQHRTFAREVLGDKEIYRSPADEFIRRGYPAPYTPGNMALLCAQRILKYVLENCSRVPEVRID